MMRDREAFWKFMGMASLFALGVLGAIAAVVDSWVPQDVSAAARSYLSRRFPNTLIDRVECNRWPQTQRGHGNYVACEATVNDHVVSFECPVRFSFEPYCRQRSLRVISE